MSITLGGISLPPDLEWQDEFDWSAVRQSAEVSLKGTQLIEEAPVILGRPVTLFGGPNAAWVSRTVVESLHALANIPATPMTMVYFGTSYQVMWRRASEKPLEARQVMRVRNPDATQKYYITLRLMVVG